MPQQNYSGKPAVLQVLRSPEWLQQVEARVGAQVRLDLNEIGLHGWATITSIKPCPPLAEGNGRVVLATMETTANNVLEIVLKGHETRGPPGGKEEIGRKKEENASILRPTATHPIFSETAQK
jgi:hypothetical protein